MTTVLELNDADLTLYRDGRPVYRAPGIAVVTDRGILFGEPALRLSRIYPRQTNLQYLGRMSADPLPHPGPGARNHADLVYLHLRELVALVEEEIILAVPAVFSAEQDRVRATSVATPARWRSGAPSRTRSREHEQPVHAILAAAGEPRRRPGRCPSIHSCGSSRGTGRCCGKVREGRRAPTARIR